MPPGVTGHISRRPSYTCPVPVYPRHGRTAPRVPPRYTPVSLFLWTWLQKESGEGSLFTPPRVTVFQIRNYAPNGISVFWPNMWTRDHILLDTSPPSTANNCAQIPRNIFLKFLTFRRHGYANLLVNGPNQRRSDAGRHRHRRTITRDRTWV